MKYLLFINYVSDLKHNAIYDSISDIHDSLFQLVNEEDLNIITEQIPSVPEIQESLDENDDYLGRLSNGTWYHIQGSPIFETEQNKTNGKSEKYRLFILSGERNCQIFRNNKTSKFDDIKDEIMLYEFTTKEAMDEFFLSIDE